MTRVRHFLLAAVGVALLAGAANAARPGERACALATEDCWVSAVVLAGDPAVMFERALEPAAPAAAEPPAARRSLKPGQAVMLSALVPGGSQIHDRSLRGYVMLGLEAGLWFAYQGLHSGGRDRQASAERLAASAYSIERDSVNAARSGQVSPGALAQYLSQLREWQRSSPSEYQDAIARDPGLIYGWSDFQAGTNSSAQHDQFVQRRDDGNRLLQHANAILSGVLLNHVVSAFDAYRSVRKFQRELPMGVSMKVDLQPFSGRGAVVFTRKL